MLKTESVLLDLSEASQFLGVSETTVLQLALEGKLPISTIRTTSEFRIFFRRDDLWEFANQYSDS
jgi:predicted DNA-binding transcriptional regulator AlpA